MLVLHVPSHLTSNEYNGFHSHILIVASFCVYFTACENKFVFMEQIPLVICCGIGTTLNCEDAEKNEICPWLGGASHLGSKSDSKDSEACKALGECGGRCQFCLVRWWDWAEGESSQRHLCLSYNGNWNTHSASGQEERKITDTIGMHRGSKIWKTSWVGGSTPGFQMVGKQAELTSNHTSWILALSTEHGWGGDVSGLK